MILAAGAVASPQLLEVSGIGAGGVLKGLGVPLVHEAPGVGENLQDHYMIGCQWPVKPEYKTVNELSHGFQLAKEIVKYAVSKKGLLTYAVAHVVAFTRTPRRARPSRRPVPSDGRLDGPGSARPHPEPGAREDAGRHLHALPAPPGDRAARSTPDRPTRASTRSSSPIISPIRSTRNARSRN